jgi:PTS system nitrogen regulatory IIA component
MVVGDFLSPADAFIDVEAPNKNRLLKELSDRAASALGLSGGAIATHLLKREALGSTGVGGGVAIPHARLAGVARPYAIVARLKQPIDFAAVDDQPVDVVFLLLLPATTEGDQINALACVARALRDRQVLQSVRSATDGKALFTAITAPR